MRSARQKLLPNKFLVTRRTILIAISSVFVPKYIVAGIIEDTQAAAAVAMEYMAAIDSGDDQKAIAMLPSLPDATRKLYEAAYLREVLKRKARGKLSNTRISNIEVDSKDSSAVKFQIESDAENPVEFKGKSQTKTLASLTISKDEKSGRFSAFGFRTIY